MSEENKVQKRSDLLFLILLIIFISGVAIFNYFVDPYYIFHDSTIRCINNVKTHKYSNKRTIIYSDIKLNSKNKDIIFTGNCLLSHYGSGLDNVGFFTIPVAKVEEVAKIIQNLHKVSPNIKTIYWGLFYDDFWNTKNDEVSDSLQELGSKYPTLQDFINLFFSWNTTKYSIETVIDSIKNGGKDIIYVYPFREIAKKTYNKEFTYESLDTVKEMVDYAKNNNINLVIYYSPIHVSKKVHIYEKGMWESNQELKRRLAKITPFYDYSLFNDYNYAPLDEKNFDFIDNIHPTNSYNNRIVYDLLKENKEIATLVTEENAEVLLPDDTMKLQDYMKNNKEICEKIKNVKKEDSEIAVRRQDAV